MEIKINSKRTVIEFLAVAIFLFWAVNHIDMVKEALRYILNVLAPILTGCAFAFILNVPMKALEKRLKKYWQASEKMIRVVSLVLALLCVILALVFLFAAIIPELIRTVRDLNKEVPKLTEQLNLLLVRITGQYPEAEKYFSELELNWSGIMESAVGFLKNGVSNLLASTWGVATSVIGVVSTVAVGFIISLYILLRKELLCLQTKKMMYAYLPEKIVKQILKVAALANRMFSGFIASQCMEAVIFGCLTYLAMRVFRFPYASSVSVLIGFTTLIPVVGAFVGTALGMLLILVDSPIRAIWFVVMIMVLQQFDNNLIYPRVVGTSVGLPGMWVLIAVTLGGSLMGVIGMLVFVPLFSVFYQLLGENMRERLCKKKIKEEQLLN